MQMRGDRRLIEALNDFGEESGDDEALGDLDRDTAGAEIEKFVFVNLTAGGAVTASHVVSHNFETGHRVRFGIVAQEKIAHLLISVGEMRVRFDANQAAERAASTIVKRVLVKQIAGGVGGDVVLQGAGIEFLLASATATASKSLRAPSPMSRLKLSNRE